MIRLMVL